MRRDIARRLRCLERRVGIVADLPARAILEITFRGGLTSGIARIASFGTHEREAAPDETFEAFRARAKAAAEAEGATHIVFGGMPGPELIAAGYFECRHPNYEDALSSG